MLHPRPGRLLMKSVLKGLQGRRRPHLICMATSVDDAHCKDFSQIGWGLNPEFLSTSEWLSLTVTIKHSYVVCWNDPEFGCNKVDALIKHFCGSGHKLALVFIHRDNSITEWVKYLIAKGLRAEELFSKMLEMERYEEFLEQFRTGKIEIVVSTIQTVCGLDLNFLEIVYLMEVPIKAVDYLHLAGWVGRAGKRGRQEKGVEGECERELIRMQRWHRRLHVDGWSWFWPDL